MALLVVLLPLLHHENACVLHLPCTNGVQHSLNNFELDPVTLTAELAKRNIFSMQQNINGTLGSKGPQILNVPVSLGGGGGVNTV